MNRTPAIALAAAALLLAGCGSTPSPNPGTTDGPVLTASVPPDGSSLAHVQLVVKATVGTTVHYSNGDTTTAVELAPESHGVATTEFDAPVPWVVAGTVTAGAAAAVGCELYVDGKLVASSEGADDADGPALVACAATQDLPWPTAEAEEAAAMVVLKSTSSSDAWNGWVVNDWVEHRMVDSLGVGGNWQGRARLVVVPQRTSDIATCTITVNGTERATATTSGPGDIATCSARRRGR